MARKTGLRGLQEWAKHVTQGYSNIEITNMTTSFRNGLAFCAIIHHYRPDLIPYNTLRKEDVLKNNQLAFTVAENELDIPALLDAEDMVALSVPDKLSVATYLVQYYNYFKDKAPSSVTTVAAGQKVPPPSLATQRTEQLPPTKKAKVEVETIGPSHVVPSPKTSPAKIASPKSPPTPLEADKKSKSSPLFEPKAPPTQNITPPTTKKSSPVKHVSPAKVSATSEDKSVAKESTPEPVQQQNRVKKGRKSKFKTGSMGMEMCDVCGQRVFLMERLSVEGHLFHRACFKCFTCKCLLKPGTYEHDSKGDVFYCQAHYREALRQSTLKRTMQQRGLTNGEGETVVKKKKEEEVSSGSGSSKSSPVHEITREESQKIKAGLPGLLKSLAGNKQEEVRESSTSPKQTTSPQKTTPPQETSPLKQTPSSPNKEAESKVQSSATPSKPEPPKTAVDSSKDGETSERGKLPVQPPRRPTWSPKVQQKEPPKRPTDSPKTTVEHPPRRPTWSPKPTHEFPKRTTETPKVGAVHTTGDQASKMAGEHPPRRPTWSPKPPTHEFPKRTTETPKIGVVHTSGDQTSKTVGEHPPRRPTWSPKPPHEPPKMASEETAATSSMEAPKKATGIGGSPEPPRRPTWSPKLQPVKGERSKGELPKSTVAWMAKGKDVSVQRSPNAPRHATFSGIPAKPSPPVTTRQVDRKVDVKVDVIQEEPAIVPAKPSPAPPPEGSPGPMKPPRRKKLPEKSPPPKPAPYAAKEEPAAPPPAKEGPLKEVAKSEAKRDSVVPKRPAPPRPNRPPSMKVKTKPPMNEVDLYAVNEQKHKKRLTELRRELRTLEQNQLKLEAKGIQLERQLRDKDIELDDHLMEEWFSLVNEKNMLVREESNLVYELRDLELIEQHDQLEKEIRQRVAKDDSLKSEMEKLEEEAMINELVELVEKRNELLWALHLEKGRDEEEDKQVELIATISGYSLPKPLLRSKTHI